MLAEIERDSGAFGLIVMGALHPAKVDAKQLESGTLILLGAGPGFWQVFSAAPEARDKKPDPVDRWSSRTIGTLASRFAARAIYPFGGPPYAPFIDWAIKSGRAFQSPTGMLVHDKVGTMISYRGALHFEAEIDFPDPSGENPCDTCQTKPCTSACPVSALSATFPYDVAACHDYLDTQAGNDCMENGCAARRACPLSRNARRTSGQSAHHMKAFHLK